ncbi:hypothetical protein GCM10018980_63720 [Streptomyces capoamus]|uniref:Uncharacterized protein n=2 Tax=Streptomyces capoamus TaxID=68183 RepID=A0A919KER2_9ACTN|nr:hypothetical protein GCM10010501_23380 [Streptomyces libani subsp. rufus]GHG69498.1 hypothetical protein GCM10018980_63720 [Streptomyces capoamus]
MSTRKRVAADPLIAFHHPMTDGTTVDVVDAQILDKQIILGIKILREHLGCSLQDALRAYTDRYEVLREQRPDDFVCGRDEYWAGFFS